MIENIRKTSRLNETNLFLRITYFGLKSVPPLSVQIPSGLQADYRVSTFWPRHANGPSRYTLLLRCSRFLAFCDGSSGMLIE
jgi:hypothetical protein